MTGFTSDLIMRSIENAHMMLVRLVERQKRTEENSSEVQNNVGKSNQSKVDNSHLDEIA